jgi:hypothetical protein
MGTNGSAHRWFLVIKPEQRELFEILRERLDGSGVEVMIDRRRRERRRGSLGPGMDRRTTERRRQRPIAHVAVASAPEEVSSPPRVTEAARVEEARPRDAALAQRCPTCAEPVELEMPRFPHPPARVDMEVGHLTGNGRDGHHYVEIAAFTVSGRLILSQRVPARRPTH